MSEDNSTFVIKDSGQRQSFDTGAVRDVQEGKPRYELIPPTALYRLAMHFTNGARKYSDMNYAKGMPFSRFGASMFRHLMAWMVGDKSEDHLSALAWGAMAVMHFEDMGRKDLDDLNDRWFPGIEVKDLNEAYNKLTKKYETNSTDTK